MNKVVVTGNDELLQLLDNVVEIAVRRVMVEEKEVYVTPPLMDASQEVVSEWVEGKTLCKELGIVNSVGEANWRYFQKHFLRNPERLKFTYRHVGKGTYLIHRQSFNEAMEKRPTSKQSKLM